MDEPIKRDALGRIEPGQRSINPSGRTKGMARYQQWLDENALDLAKKALLECLVDPDGRVRMMAVKEVADRMFGKAPQSITGEDGKPIAVAIGAELIHALRRLGDGG